MWTSKLGTLFYVVGLAAAVISCADSDDHGAASAQGASSGGGGGAEGGIWTECSSPSGYRVCGGQTPCVADEACGVCSNTTLDPSDVMGYCYSDAYLAWTNFEVRECGSCRDGDLCLGSPYDPDGGRMFWACAPFELGQLYANHGETDRVRYADGTPWTGAPLPLPETCAAGVGVDLCGGYCGLCGAGQLCTGRSPNHPYGICVAFDGSDCRSGDPSCGAGRGCFMLANPSLTEDDGWRPGYCLPAEACEAAVDGLPGGGECVL